MRTIRFFAVFAITVVVLSACKDDDDRYTQYWVDIATVENPESKNEFFFRLDDNTLLWTEESNFATYNPEDGQRIIANYSVLSDKRNTGLYDYDVKLNDVFEVLTKGIYAISPETQDSIGNDSIAVSEIWVGSKYLNIEFYYSGYSKTHFINLVADSTKTYDDEKTHLEFRHNANDDTPVSKRWGIVSFDISSLQANDVDSVNLVVHVNEPFQAEEELYELTYYYDGSASNVKRKTTRSAFIDYSKDLHVE